MLCYHKLVTLFCQIDDFCREVDEAYKAKLLERRSQKKRGPKRSLCNSEIMTILIMFHEIRFRDFKTFYTYVKNHWQDYFAELRSYSCFINRMKEVMLPMTLFVQVNSGQCTGIYYIDASCLPVCHRKRCTGIGHSMKSPSMARLLSDGSLV